jgi:hypothetical protein
MVVLRYYSGFEKIGCWSVVRKVWTHIEHAFRVRSREQILARLMVLENWRYHFCSGLCQA